MKVKKFIIFWLNCCFVYIIVTWDPPKHYAIVHKPNKRMTSNYESHEISHCVIAKYTLVIIINAYSFIFNFVTWSEWQHFYNFIYFFICLFILSLWPTKLATYLACCQVHAIYNFPIILYCNQRLGIQLCAKSADSWNM